MSVIELKMPRMGESISEATILTWVKNIGDTIEEDETILEVATDKVDSEIPSPCDGVITAIFFQPNEVVAIGEVLAVIKRSGSVPIDDTKDIMSRKTTPEVVNKIKKKSLISDVENSRITDVFLSPLVIRIAQQENVSIEEIQRITGSGTGGRIQKSDIMRYIKNRKYALPSRPQSIAPNSSDPVPSSTYVEGKDRIIEMDRMRTLIADHMVYSKQIAPHVTSYIEVDVTNLVQWRNRHKVDFQKKYGEKLTFTPIFIEAVAKAIKKYPLINVSVATKKIIVHKDINIGMATALPSGHLIVPVIKQADEKDLLGLVKNVNHLADSARNNALKPDEIGGSTFTISNVGTFGSLMGTPIINQPEVAILALGIIKKRPEVITTDTRDEIAIRSMMYLSLSFDHRVVDGFLGGSFLRTIGDELEAFDIDRTI